MLGFLNINKPVGISSHDVVARLRKATRVKQIGHGGTLDPLAEGVMTVAFGKATRLLRFLDEDKAYKAKILLGRQTATDDLEGAIIAEAPIPETLSHEELRNALAPFIGAIEQVPPIYSAIQINGERLYDLARNRPDQLPDKSAIAPRSVTVYKIETLDIDLPYITLDISCSKGTYIRSIARDLGMALGSRATLAHLLRTRAGRLDIKDSIALADFEQIARQQNLAIDRTALQKYLARPEDALIPKILTLSATIVDRLCLGQKIALSNLDKIKDLTETFYLIARPDDGNHPQKPALVARVDRELDILRPEVVFAG